MLQFFSQKTIVDPKKKIDFIPKKVYSNPNSIYEKAINKIMFDREF